MKSISIKLDDYLLALLSKEATEKRVTRMELIRSAIVNYLVNRDDAEDLAYIQAHKKDRLINFDDVFNP